MSRRKAMAVLIVVAVGIASACLALAIKSKLEVSWIIASTCIYVSIIASLLIIYTLSCKLIEVKERNARLCSLLGTPKQFVYEDTKSDTLYIRREDIPEIIKYLYGLQEKTGVGRSE